MDELFNQIKNKKYLPITDAIWETIQYEGIDEEQNLFEKTDWEYIELEISAIQIEGLKKLKTETVEEFNLFDYKLKENFKNHIDLIFYDEGIVRIIRPIKK